MRTTTLVYLLRDNNGQRQLCLAMKKRGFGTGRWNGAGGKADPGETPEQAAARELMEELGVQARQLQHAAVLRFTFAEKPEWNQQVHAYLCTAWDGEPAESEEMRPQWWPADALPYADMWPSDAEWLRHVLAGEYVRGDIRLRVDGRVEGAQLMTSHARPADIIL